ncbi:MAG: translesion DNA synthesis-associated protein ImuA [Thauera sp.]|nr:translesion DNA synthesis-associated protein ImuA [Thauera sp.]
MGAAVNVLSSTPAIRSALATLPAGAVWHASQLAHGSGPVLPSGFAALDAELPGGGWPANALIELLVDRPGIGELSLLLPVLCTTPPERWLAWISPPFLPYAPALVAAGIPLSRLLLIRPAEKEILWAARQAVSSGACTAVLAWPQHIDTAGLRRLQLAAEDASTPLFLFRPRAAALQSSPAPLRLILEGGSAAQQITILKRRGPPAAKALHLPLHKLPAHAGLATDNTADAECNPPSSLQLAVEAPPPAPTTLALVR